MTSSYYSKTFKTGDGATTAFTLDFAETGGDLGVPYLSTAHIKAYLDGVVVDTADYTVAGATLTFDTAPASGVVIKLARETPKLATERIVNFTSGAVLTEDALDKSALQTLFLSQESLDDATVGMGLDVGDTKWDAETKVISSAGTPVDSKDVATKEYVDTSVLFPESGGFTDPQMWELTGDGATTTFQLTSPTPNSAMDMLYIVEVDGVSQVPKTSANANDFDIVTNTDSTVDIVFQADAFGAGVTAPPASSAITVRNFGLTRNVLGSHIIVESDSTSDVTLGAKGKAGQTANIIEGQNESGVAKFSVSSAGATTVNSLTSASTVSAGGAISTTTGDISTASGAITGTGVVSGASLSVTGAVGAGGAISTTSGNISTASGAMSCTGNISTTAGNLSAQATATGDTLLIKGESGVIGLLVRTENGTDGTYTATPRVMIGGGQSSTVHQKEELSTVSVKEVTGNDALTGSAPATVDIQDSGGTSRITMSSNKSPLATSNAGTVVKVKGASGQTASQLEIVNDADDQYIKARAHADTTGTHLELKAKSGQTGSILKILDSTGATKFEINADGSATGIPFAYGKATAGSTANTTGVSAVAQESMNGDSNRMLKITFSTPRANSNYGVMIEPYNYNDTTPSVYQYTYQIVQKHTDYFRVALTREHATGSYDDKYNLIHTSVNNVNFQCTDAP